MNNPPNTPPNTPLSFPNAPPNTPVIPHSTTPAVNTPVISQLLTQLAHTIANDGLEHEEFLVKVVKTPSGEPEVKIAYPQRMCQTYVSQPTPGAGAGHLGGFGQMMGRMNPPDINKGFFGGGGGGGGGNNNRHEFQPVDLRNENLALEKVGGLNRILTELDTGVLTPFICGGIEGTGRSDIPKGILFHGPPGTGKTLLSRTIGQFLTDRMETPVSFFQVKGSEFYDKYIGESERKLRSVFAEAHKFKPAIIFFDEFDAICPSRSGSDSTMSHFTQSVVDTLLGTLDEVVPGQVLIIGATNLLDSIDPAVRRPGRFDHIFAVPLPDEEGRREIFTIHSKICNPPATQDQINLLARGSGGFSGADIQSVCVKVKKIAREKIAIPQGIEKYSKKYYAWRKTVDVVVTNEDWKTALDNTSPSAVGCFGSSIYKPQAPLEDVRRVLAPLLKEATADIKNFCAIGPIGISSFFFWGTSQGAPLTINHRIIPEFVSDSSIPTYLINPELLVSSQMIAPLAKIRSVIKEISLTGKSAVLVLQDLDSILTILSNTPAGPETFAAQLKELDLKRTLLFASAAHPIEVIKTVSTHVAGLFSLKYSFELKLPGPAEKVRIFENLLDSTGLAKKDKDSLMNEILSNLNRSSTLDFEDLWQLKKEFEFQLKVENPKDRSSASKIIKQILKIK